MDGAAPSLLFGRDAALHHVASLIERVSGHGAALVVRGDAGIGKSSLLLHASERARACGCLVVTITGVPSEAQLAFAALERLVRHMPEAVRHLPGPQQTALETALGRRTGPAPDPFLVALAALGLLSDVATDRPLVLVVEDAQWVDPPTCEVLAFVARRIELEPIVLLLAVRDGVRSVLDGAGLPELRLGPLDDAAARQVLECAAPGLPAEARARILRASVGNPLALVELPKALSSDDALALTDRLEQVFTVRVGECSDETRTLLTLAALEQAATLSELVAAAGLLVERPIAAGALEPAVAAGLGTVVEGSFRFRHPLMRSAVQQACTGSERRRAHAALAEVLADDPDRSVWHRAAAAPARDEEVALELEAAASRAEMRGGGDVAVAALRLASDLSAEPVRAGMRMLRAAELAFELGRRDLSVRMLRDCQNLELSEHDRLRVAYMLELQDGRWSGASAIEAFARVAEGLSRAGDVRRALHALDAVGIRSHWVALDARTRDAIVATASRVAPSREDPSFLSVTALADPIGQGPEVIRRLDGWKSAVLGDPRAHFSLGQAAAAVWTDHAALPHLRDAGDGFRAGGRLGLLAQALVFEGWAHVHLGNVHAVVTRASEAARLAAETGQVRYEAAAKTALAIAEAERGHEQAATELCSSAEALLLSTGVNPMLSLVELARGRTALAFERFTEAYDHLVRIFDPGDLAHQPFICGWVLADIAEAAVRGEGDLELVRRLARKWERVAAAVGASHLTAQLALTRALLSEDEDADAALAAAVAQTLDWPSYRARAQLARGAWLRRHRRVADARACLRDAANVLAALGSSRRADRARRELRAAGESVRRTSLTAARLLTAQELQIAQLAAEGLTNREIGEKLYLSHRTVGSHLYKLFPKLGVTSRHELRAVLVVPAGPAGRGTGA